MVQAPLGAATPGMWRREPGTVVRRTEPLPESAAAILAGSRIVPAPTEWPPHAHRLHELVWVRGGTLTSRMGDRVYTVVEGYGLWMPAGMVHEGRATAQAELFHAFFAPDRIPFAFTEPMAITMTPLLESLLTHLSCADIDGEARARAESVVFDVIRPSERQFALRLPGDPRIDAIAEALLDDPSDGRSLEEWARLLGTSDRTITRAFRQATGLPFAQWRQMLRVHRALMLLAEDIDVTTVSEVLGYAQPSSFIVAFRRVMGITPGAFSDAAAGPSGGVRNSVSRDRNSGLSTRQAEYKLHRVR
ncbi:helix-turn-helix domain-containing protein [Streptomyces clavuligerus]|nr:AraC family transcriptional regulator [Streptomyces clavuligerus]ANW21751.1 AraC family transcriptional regulator [Streptomyces clavuligerus]AXU16382.1 AraC family transcriptional regulator [Streptomyces clavuligerus]MBY6301354.1 helix-turn-helix domain-containing protein [Streptomyces clavuligerus]QCS09164.1 AraC family transcriptional regulator [Streptomyces clavuligerus]QPJ96210.1 helix-turn-helix domain-containing protein [Streptomyces clavuligerus]